MKKIWSAALLVVLTGSFLPLPSRVEAYDVASAQSYLIAHNNSPWTVMGLAALGVTGINVDRLKAIQANTAIQYAAPILAIVAVNQDPRTFGDRDYLEALKGFHTNSQLGDISTLNDDIFGILALVAAGVPISDQVIADSKNFLLSHQNADGGWGFTTTSGSDTNMTATAILALEAAALPSTDLRIQNAANYLRTAQNADGGFPYDPQSTFGTVSDSSSTAWVIWALNALGIAPASWAKNGNTPISYLEDNQAPSGYFAFQKDSKEDSFSPTTTSYAVIALSGKTLPLQSGGGSGSSLFKFRIEGSQEQICAGQAAGPTALDIVKNASLFCGFSYEIQQTSFGPYLQRVGSDQATGLTGWLYLVNFLSPAVGAADYPLQLGDEVVWYYGNFDWQPTRLTIAESKIGSGQSTAVKVDFLADNSWKPLADGVVRYGIYSVTTDSNGGAVLAPQDGSYEVFAVKTGFVRSNQELLQVGQGSQSSIALKVNVEPGPVEGERISFVVAPQAIDFGTLKPGEAAERNVKLTNTGTVRLHLESMVSGDSVFQQELLVGSQVWPSFSLELNPATSQDTPLRLAIPPNYQSLGVKNGEITFWAVAQ